MTPDQTMLIGTKDTKHRRVSTQMPVEKNIAFSVIPAMVIGQRLAYPPPRLAQAEWQRHLEQGILSTIDHVSVQPVDQAAAAVGTIEHVRLSRLRGNVRSVIYFMKESLKP
jgi:hypothetical protein